MNNWLATKVLWLILAAVMGMAAAFTAYSNHQENLRLQRVSEEEQSRQRIVESIRHASEATAQANDSQRQKATAPKLP